MRTCVIIPVYNHGDAVGGVARAANSHGLPVILVDDGSAPECAQVLDRLCDGSNPDFILVRLPKNLGKGGAMMAGLREAHARGYSHALQIDADGQHDTRDIPAFLEQSRQQEQSLICGCPLYDDSVPKGRLYGRYATHIWVWINTLSLDIRDSMCGFRIYPLPPVIRLLDEETPGLRMDFDVEILVRLHWRGLPIVNLPTKVHYPQDGISHFHPWRDNLLISRMHALLFAGMLWRLPRLLLRKAGWA